MIKRSYAKCTPLFQSIKLINAMRRNPTDTILETILPKIINLIVYYHIALKRSIWTDLHMIQFVELEIVLYVNCDYV